MRPSLSWSAVALVAALLASSVGLWFAGAHELATALGALAIGLVTPLRLTSAARRGDSERPGS